MYFLLSTSNDIILTSRLESRGKHLINITIFVNSHWNSNVPVLLPFVSFLYKDYVKIMLSVSCLCIKLSLTFQSRKVFAATAVVVVLRPLSNIYTFLNIFIDAGLTSLDGIRESNGRLHWIYKGFIHWVTIVSRN